MHGSMFPGPKRSRFAFERYTFAVHTGGLVKKYFVGFATAVALISVVPAQAINNVVPEPSSSAQLIVGLIALAGLALVARKYVSRPEAE